MDHKDYLKEAARLLNERGAAYGGVEESFTRAADLASLKLNRTITAYDVCIVLESVKDARRAINPEHFDSHVDGINYRAFAARFSGAAPTPVPITTPVPRNLSDAMKAVDAAVNGGGQ